MALPGRMYLQDIVSSRRTRFNSVFIFNCPFFFFSASDDIGIERELFLPESTFTYTAVKARTLWSFFFLQRADAARGKKRGEVTRRCGFKTCHQANYVFMKEVEQISG